MRAFLVALVFGTLTTSDAGAQTIRIDGRFDDWAAVAPAATSARGLVRAVSVTADARRVYFLFTLADSINLQGSPTPLRLTVNGAGPVLGEPFDGFAGEDVVIDFSPGEGSIGTAIRFPGETEFRGTYDVDLRYAPSHASDRFEVAVSRRAAGVAPLSRDTIEGTFQVLPDGDPLHFEALLPAAPWSARTRTALRPESADDLVVLTWNMGGVTPLQTPAPYRRILAAAAPHVVLFDELAPAAGENEIRALLPPGEWTIAVGRGGGRQRTAVASTLPTTPSAALAHVAWPDSISALANETKTPQLQRDLAAAEQGVPSMGAIVTYDGIRILFVPIDMPCCGHIGNAEDRARVMVATSLADAIRESIRTEGPDAVVIGGDLNLVGSIIPLNRLTRHTSPEGGDLTPAVLATPNGEVSTWRAPGPFPPGRLDWVLLSPGLVQTGGLILDTAELDDAILRGAGLQRSDAQVTDHLPMVTWLRRR